MADPAPFARHQGIAGAHLDSHPHGIGARPGLAPRLLPDAFGPDRLPVPAIEAEDAIGLGYGMPALDIGEGFTLMMPDPDMLLAELPREQPDLALRERHQ